LAPIHQEQVQEVRNRYALPENYVLYPANMWPHKNHVNLLEALALVRDREGLVVPLVCTGSLEGGSWPQVQARLHELGLQNQVHCLGFLPEADLRVIQQDAHCLVQTSLFEASSLPIFDAWMDGVPVACSRVTALPEQVEEAAILPMSSQRL
jgi:glycosyltransferase involved in cell wall biosynthesis